MSDLRGSVVVVSEKAIRVVEPQPGKVGKSLKCELFFDLGGDFHLDPPGIPILVQVNGTTAFTLHYNTDENGAKNGSADLTPLLGPGTNSIDGYCLAVKAPVFDPTSGRIRLSTDNNVTVVDQSFSRSDVGAEVQHGGPWPFTQ